MIAACWCSVSMAAGIFAVAAEEAAAASPTVKRAAIKPFIRRDTGETSTEHEEVESASQAKSRDMRVTFGLTGPWLA